MAPPRANTPSRHRSSQAVKAGPEPEVDTEAETSAPRAKTPHQRRHNQVTETEPEAETENNETLASRALTSWHNRRRPSQPTEADPDVKAENQIEDPTQATIPTTNPSAPHQWSLYFANLVRSPFIPSSSCFFSQHAHCLLSTLLLIHSHHNNTLTYI